MHSATYFMGWSKRLKESALVVHLEECFTPHKDSVYVSYQREHLLWPVCFNSHLLQSDAALGPHMPICPQGHGVCDAARWPTVPLPSAGSIWFPAGARKAFLFHQSRSIWRPLSGISSLRNHEADCLRQKTQCLLLVKVKVGPEMC